jgi:hypothetical protein
VRPPPRLFQTTSQTPALPGFAVSGDAKFTWFETFRVSSGFRQILSLTPTSDPSVLKAVKSAEAVSVQKSAPFERVQIASSVGRLHSIGTVSHPHSRGSFERVQMSSSIGQSPGCKGSRSTHYPSSFERVQFAAAHPSTRASTATEHDPYLNAFKRNPGHPRSGQSPDTQAAASPFERVQMLRERTQFPMPSRPRHPNGPPRRPPVQTPRPHSTSNPKEANPMSSTQ